MKRRWIFCIAIVVTLPFAGSSSSARAQAVTQRIPGPENHLIPVALTASNAPSSAPPAIALPDAPAPTVAVSADHDRSGEREVTWRSLPGDFLHDQKNIWLTFPGQLARGRHWIPVLAISGATAGLIYADPHIMPWFRTHLKDFDKFNDVFDPMITTGEVIAIPVGLLAAGYARHDPYQVSTGIMSGLAYGDSVTVNLVIKAITRRQRPADVPPGGSYTGTFFNGGKSPLKGSSFPSGHATAAFSVATVVSYRYRNHKWVPWAAYGLASAIAFSRISSEAHFPSDVFLGSAIGYAVARFQTVRPQ